jgi:hypothetical protein
MAFGEPNNPTEPKDEKLPPDDWFEEPETVPLPEEEEPEELLPPFEEIRAPPEYFTCADA